MGKTWQIVFATVVIFAAGALTGGLLVAHVRPTRGARVDRSTNSRPANWQPAPGDMMRRGTNELRPMLEQQRMEFLVRAQRELRLDPEQRARVERIIREGQERTRDFWEKTQPELRRLVHETREHIRAELTPEQRTRFEELLKQQRPQRTAEASGQGERRPGAKGSGPTRE